jgi:hypothetical protein
MDWGREEDRCRGPGIEKRTVGGARPLVAGSLHPRLLAVEPFGLKRGTAGRERGIGERTCRTVGAWER